MKREGMPMDFSYRFLQGREGVSGHARCGESGQQLWARGLAPETECCLYQWKAGDGICIAAEKADESGQVHFFELPAGPLFLAAAGRLVLWETDAPEENYWRAWEFLRRTKEEKRKENGAFPTKEAPAEKTEEQTAKAAEAEKFLIEETLEIPAETEEYTLRNPGKNPGVDELPALLFPGRAGVLKKYFQSCPPIQPFSAPGWRFVRAPSPIPGAAYCALGYLARDGRAEKIAYAIPGSPHHPPAQLTGYRYHEGFWVIALDSEAK